MRESGSGACIMALIGRGFLLRDFFLVGLGGCANAERAGEQKYCENG